MEWLHATHVMGLPSRARTHTKARCMESNKGTCKPQLVPLLTIWRVTVRFGESKACFVLLNRPTSNRNEENVYSWS